MSGVTRIVTALNEYAALFSDSPLVPRNSPFHSAYLASRLKKITQARQLYKSVEVDSTKKLYINYGLRAATLSVIEATKQHRNAVTAFITVQLTEQYYRHLKAIDCSSVSQGEPPISRLREVLRRKLFDKFEIKHEYFVVERGAKNSTIHLHIVCSLQCPEVSSMSGVNFETTDTCKRLKKAIRAMHEVETYQTAVQVKTEYKRELYTKVIGQEQTELLELEIDLLGDQSGWQRGKAFTDITTGEVSYISYKTTGLHPIDSGIADYLSKSLNDKVFMKSRYNFSISSATRKELKLIANEVIDRNRST